MLWGLLGPRWWGSVSGLDAVRVRLFQGDLQPVVRPHHTKTGNTCRSSHSAESEHTADLQTLSLFKVPSPGASLQEPAAFVSDSGQ